MEMFEGTDIGRTLLKRYFCDAIWVKVN